MKAATVFRQFSHGSYAVFASLHREVRIGVLSVSMLASVNIPKVQALQICVHPDTDEDDETTELSEVSVAGTMAPLTALQNTRIVSVITAQQIESSAAQSVNDLLKSVAGVDVRQRGGFGIQTDISIDGATFDQITILLNGVNISSPHTGHLSADFPVSLSDIERIEVLEGAASRVYGASAFGGAINIVTKRGKTIGQDKNPLHLDAGVQGGSYATYGADARFSIHSAPSFTRPAGTLNLSASYLRSDGATVNSDFQRGNAYLSGCIDAEDFRIDWQAGYSQKAYGANTFYSAAYPNQYERNRRYIISAGAETKGRIRMRPGIYWNRLYDHFELIRGTTTGENFHCTDVYGARIIADLHWVAGRTAVGAEDERSQLEPDLESWVIYTRYQAKTFTTIAMTIAQTSASTLSITSCSNTSPPVSAYSLSHQLTTPKLPLFNSILASTLLTPSHLIGVSSPATTKDSAFLLSRTFITRVQHSKATVT